MKHLTTYTAAALLGLLMLLAGCDSAQLSGTQNEAGNLTPGPVTGTSHHGATPVEYEIIDLGTLGGDDVRPLDINEAGQVVGYSRTASGANHAFIWDAVNGMRDLGTLGAEASSAVDINEAGQVIGEYGGTDALFRLKANRSFIWDEAGGMRDLGDLDGSDPFTNAHAINDAGQVVGVSNSELSGSISGVAFIWDETTGIRPLIASVSSSRATGYASDINNAGQVTGARGLSFSDDPLPFRWDFENGSQILDFIIRGFAGRGSAINSSGQVAGFSRGGFPVLRATIWDAEGNPRDLGLAEGLQGQALDINNDGQVVGVSRDISSSSESAFYWDEAGGVQDVGPVFIDNRLENSLFNQFVTIRDEFGVLPKINNRGQITGSIFTDDRTLRGFVWDQESGRRLLPVMSAEDQTLAAGINDAGQIIGARFMPSGEVTAVLWQPVQNADTTPPEITYKLGRKNHFPRYQSKKRMVLYGSATDDSGAPPAVSVTVTCRNGQNNPCKITADEDFTSVENTDGSFELYAQAERTNRNDNRTYTVTITAEDRAGNVTEEVLEGFVSYGRAEKGTIINDRRFPRSARQLR